MFLLLNSANTVYAGPFIDDTDGKTPKTSLTVSVRVSKNGAASVARNSGGAITHDTGGNYPIPLSSTDCNTAGILTVSATGTNALPWTRNYFVTSAAAMAFLNAGTAYDVNVNSWNGSTSAVDNSESFLNAATALATMLSFFGNAANLTNMLNFFNATGYNAAASTVGTVNTVNTATNLTNAPAGTFNVDVTKLNGNATAADNARKFFDNTGFNASNSNVGTVGLVGNVISVATVAGLVEANIAKIAGRTDLQAALMYLLDSTAVTLVAEGTNTTTQVKTTLTTGLTDFYIGKSFQVFTGTYAKLGGRVVTAYNATTKTLTVYPALPAALEVGTIVGISG